MRNGQGLTNEAIQGFVGGQMEVQNSGEGYLYRGEIASIAIKDNELQVRFVWLAKGEGFPPLPKKWVKDERLDYAASLEVYAARDVGPSGDEVGGSSRVSLYSPIVGETVVLFPPNGSKLDPSKVEGLHLANV